jgi:chorismate dehydratase
MDKVKEKCRARIGMVNFINTAPLYEVWQQTVNRPQWRITEAPPTALNRLLCRNELDLGFVSSHEYAARPHLYRLLDNLSISATGPVGSVFLFSRFEPEELDNRLVLLSSQSQTSVALVKIILEEFYQVFPVYALNAGEKPQEAAAVLAIGDEALRLAGEKRYPVQLDLSELWQRHTGLPFVFAVWAVREDFWQRDRECVREIQQELLRCISEGRKNLRPICEIVAPRIPMQVNACYDYLRGMEYDLSPGKKQALDAFFSFLIKRGEVPEGALPVKLID